MKSDLLPTSELEVPGTKGGFRRSFRKQAGNVLGLVLAPPDLLPGRSWKAYCAGQPAGRAAGWGRRGAWGAGLVWGLLGAARVSAQVVEPSRPVTTPTTGLQNVENLSLMLPLDKRFALGATVSHVSAPRSYAGVLQLTYTPSQYLSLMSAYVYIHNSLNRSHENRLWLSITPSLPLGRFILDDRSLLEQRFQAQGASARYKNRLRLRYQFSSEPTSYTLSAYDELTYDFNAKALPSNRISLGITKPIGKHFIPELDYLFQYNRGSSNVNYVVLLFTYQLASLAKQP